MTLEIFSCFYEKYISNFIKFRPTEAKLLYADGQTDRQAWQS